MDYEEIILMLLLAVVVLLPGCEPMKSVRDDWMREGQYAEPPKSGLASNMDRRAQF